MTFPIASRKPIFVVSGGTTTTESVNASESDNANESVTARESGRERESGKAGFTKESADGTVSDRVLRRGSASVSDMTARLSGVILRLSEASVRLSGGAAVAAGFLCTVLLGPGADFAGETAAPFAAGPCLAEPGAGLAAPDCGPPAAPFGL